MDTRLNFLTVHRSLWERLKGPTSDKKVQLSFVPLHTVRGARSVPRTACAAAHLKVGPFCQMLDLSVCSFVLGCTVKKLSLWGQKLDLCHPRVPPCLRECSRGRLQPPGQRPLDSKGRRFGTAGCQCRSRLHQVTDVLFVLSYLDLDPARQTTCNTTSHESF